MSDFSEIMEQGLRRLEIDIQAARDNFTTNPYMAMGALADLDDGSAMIVAYFEQSADAADAAMAFKTANGTPSAEEVHAQLDALYEAGGVDLSHFNGTCDCEKSESVGNNDPKVTVLDIRIGKDGKVSVEDLTAEFATSKAPEPDFTI